MELVNLFNFYLTIVLEGACNIDCLSSMIFLWSDMLLCSAIETKPVH